MLVARAPLRISLAGGGSDLPSFYRNDFGQVFSFAINKHVYIACHELFSGGIRLSYSKTENVKSIMDIEHPLIRESMKALKFNESIELGSFADVPGTGTGLGSSSAFTVALLAVLSEFKKLKIDSKLLATTASHIEIDMCLEPIGKQDQFASAFGGMNYIEYANELGNSRVDVKRLDSNSIENYMILIPTHIEHHAAKILDNINFEAKTFVIRELCNMAKMQGNQRVNNNEYGRLLNSAWVLKKQMSDDISSEEIDSMYDRCLGAGAFGSKLLGAGGGGYMLALTDSKSAIRKEFSDRTCLDVGISHEGARVVYRD